MVQTNGQKNKNKKDETYAKIKQAIIKCEFSPGQMLTERELCEMFGVSRTPVREALIQLSSEGVVKFSSRRGAIVSKISFEDMVYMFELKEALERMAVRLCVRRKTPEIVEQLKGCLEEHFQAYQNKDYELSLDKDIQFHMIFIQGAQSPQIESHSKKIYLQTRRISQITVLDPNYTENFINQHTKIYEAIRDGDEEVAEKAVSNHIVFAKAFKMERFNRFFL